MRPRRQTLVEVRAVMAILGGSWDWTVMVTEAEARRFELTSATVNEKI